MLRQQKKERQGNKRRVRKKGKTVKKSHTCEEGGALLRISFWHLLMNFEKPEKSEFWENEKNCWRYHFTRVPKITIIWDTDWDSQFGKFLSFKHVHHKSRSYSIWCMVPEKSSVRTKFYIILPFFALWLLLTTQKIKILKK